MHFSKGARAGTLGLLAVLVTMAGCDRADDGRAAPPPVGTRLDVPAGDFAWPVWLAGGSIYVLRQDADPAREEEVWRVRPGTKAERVDLPPERGCRITRYGELHKLPDGRLGLGQWCLTDDPAKDWFSLVAYQPKDGSVKRLVNLGRYPASAVIWSADLTTGYAANTSGICAGIAPLTRDGVGRFAGPVTIDGRTWRIEEEFFYADPNDDCAPQGRADLPAWLPDGRLAFVASPDSQGRSGQSRLDVPWRLYTWQVPDGLPRRVADGFQSPLGMEVTPDGRHALVAARRDNAPGLWSVDLGSGAVTRVTPGSVLGVSLAPDGRRAVIALRPNDDDIDRADLRIISLSMG